MDLAKKLKGLREGMGLSKAALARAAGVSPGFIGNLESGFEKTMSEEKARSLASVFDVSPDVIFDLLPDGHPAKLKVGAEYPDFGLVWGGPLDHDVPEPEPGKVFRLAGRYPPGTFVLQVQGDSVRGYGVHDGDHIAVRPTQSAEVGALNVVRQGNAYTLKHFDGQHFFGLTVNGGEPQLVKFDGQVDMVGVMICIVEGERRITPRPKIKAGVPKGKAKGKK